jgi:hypothetical protein
MTTDVLDPFATAEESAPGTHSRDRKKLITGGRYRLPRRDGSHKPYGWMRATNLSGAISDQKKLQDWELRTNLEGLAAAPEIYHQMVAYLQTTTPESRMQQAHRDQMAQFAERAKEAGKGNVGAQWGTARHEDWEALQVAGPSALAVPDWKRIRAVEVALAEAQLRPVPGWQEQRVLCEEFEVVGTLDNVLEDLRTGLHHIGDLKTQKRFWTFLEVEAQEALYANADARWVPESAEDPTVGHWEDMIPVDRGLGVVMWLPRVREDGTPEIEVKGIDLERGLATARLCLQVVRQRSAAKSTRAPLSGWGWLDMPTARRIERYSRAFATVESLEDGRKLTREAMAEGCWGPELQGCAQKAAARVLESLGGTA